MAAKKKAAGARREPTFEDDDGPELRATASDRASSADSAPSSKRKRRARKKRPARGIGARIGRIAYWGLVAGLWFGIHCNHARELSTDARAAFSLSSHSFT